MKFIRQALNSIYQFWKSSIIGKIVVLIGLCTFCLICSLLFAPSSEELAATRTVESIARETEAANATDTPTPTSTPEPTLTFTLTPIPTNTSIPDPTDTPIPTNTPTPAPPTPTLEPEARLKLALEETIGPSNREMEKRITSFINTNGELYIEWNINDGFTENWIKGGARLDVKNILKVVAEIGPDLNYTGVIINGTFPLVDAFGNTEEELVVDAFYNRSTIEKINFSNFLTDNVYVIADKLYIHPVFQE